MRHTPLQLRRQLASLALCSLALFSIAGCKRRESPDPTAAAPAPSPSASIQPDPPAAVWAAKAPSEWPQIVLTNEAEFRNSTPLRGASSFLIKTPDNRVLGATVGHLLGVNGGVKPTIAPEGLNKALASWYLYPRTQPDSALLATGLGAPNSAAKRYDWLILSLEHPHGNLPATPLELRARPVEIGEEVFLIGVPYSDPDRAQNVYRGRVTSRDQVLRRFKYTLDPPVQTMGFSGAPIIDKQGRVLGVFTIWFDQKAEGELDLEGGAEDTSAVLEMLKAR